MVATGFELVRAHGRAPSTVVSVVSTLLLFSVDHSQGLNHELAGGKKRIHGDSYLTVVTMSEANTGNG